MLVELVSLRIEPQGLLVGGEGAWYWAAFRNSLPLLISCLDFSLLQPAEGEDCEEDNGGRDRTLPCAWHASLRSLPFFSHRARVGPPPEGRILLNSPRQSNRVFFNLGGDAEFASVPAKGPRQRRRRTPGRARGAQSSRGRGIMSSPAALCVPRRISIETSRRRPRARRLRSRRRPGFRAAGADVPHAGAERRPGEAGSGEGVSSVRRDRRRLGDEHRGRRDRLQGPARGGPDAGGLRGQAGRRRPEDHQFLRRRRREAPPRGRHDRSISAARRRQPRFPATSRPATSSTSTT